MTKNEQKIWTVAAVIVGFALVYNFGFNKLEQLSGPARSQFGLAEARRLLRKEPKIMARAGAAAANLSQLQSRFLNPDRQTPVKLKLLRLVEEVAARSGLGVQLKNTVVYSRTELGVSLEGTAPPETVVGFLQQLTAAPLDLKVKQLQLHSVPEQKVLNYRIAISTLVVD
jgi:hypothetical protein